MSNGSGKIERCLINSDVAPARAVVGFQAGEDSVGESSPQQSEGGDAVLAASGLLVQVGPACPMPRAWVTAIMCRTYSSPGFHPV